jgi:hypothetical protein
VGEREAYIPAGEDIQGFLHPKDDKLLVREGKLLVWSIGFEIRWGRSILSNMAERQERRRTVRYMEFDFKRQLLV